MLPQWGQASVTAGSKITPQSGAVDIELENMPPILLKRKSRFVLWYTGRMQKPDATLGVTIGRPGGPPLIARILNPLGRFWLKNWQFIVGTLVSVFLAIILFLSKKN